MDTVIRLLVFVVQLTSMLIVSQAVVRLCYAHMNTFISARTLQNHLRRSLYVAGILLALEVLVAAGVLTTVLHPSWSTIGKLATVAALRSVLKRSLTFSIRHNNKRNGA